MAPPWNTACLDWEARLLSGHSLVPDLPLFKEEAERALRVFKRLRLPDVVGQPRLGDACGPWVFDLVAAVFGAYDPETARRMILEFFLLIAKKNGKSTIAAGIILTALIVNRRPAALAQFIAPTKGVADISYNQASGMIKADEELAKLFHMQRHIRTITHRRTDARAEIKAADTDVVTGTIATYTLVDETHVFSEHKRAAEVFTEIRGALAARQDGFFLQITTQSKYPPAGVFKSELDIARDVRDGKMQLPMLPILYELPKRMSQDGGWKNRTTWNFINPNLSRSVDETFLVNELMKAERTGPAALALLASQHFNVEIGLSLHSDRWAGVDYWERAGEKFELSDLLERCEVIVVAVDGGGLDDILSLNIMGRETDTRRWLTIGFNWIHRNVLNLRQSEAPRFQDFEKAGELRIVDDMTVAFRELAEIVRDVDATGLLPEKNAVGMDPMGVGLIVEALAEVGISGTERVVGIPQGWKLNGAIKTAEVKLASGELIHAGQAIGAYAAGNAKVEARGNAVTITKQAAGTAKIDPLMAMLLSVALMAMNPGSAQSVYDTMPALLNRFEIEALQYVVNAAGNATVASLDDDYEPIGPQLRAALMPRLVVESSQTGRLELTPAGLEALGASKRQQLDEAAAAPIDHEILKDPRHPRFEEMRERYERQRTANQTEDDL